MDASYGQPALVFNPAEEDLELPFGDVGDCLAEADQQAAGEADRLRKALADALRHVEAGTIPPGDRVRAWRELAGVPYLDGLTPQERAEEGIARAAAKWTPEEVAQVDAAIRTVAARKLDAWSGCDGARFALEFTTADVWDELGPGSPITKGIAGRMAAAKAAGIVANTGETTYPEGPRSRVNHNQRLTVWRAL